MTTTTATAPQFDPGCNFRDVGRSPERGVCRRPARAPTHQRPQSHLRSGIAGTRRAEGAAEVDGVGEDRDSARHRRQGDSHRQDREVGHAARPSARAGRVPQGRPRARAAGDCRGRRGAPRVGELGLGGSRRGRAARRRAPGHDLALDDQRLDDARPVEDGLPVRDRRRVRDDRLLALQRLVRAGALQRAAGQQPRHVEPDGVPQPRRVRVRHHAVQLHGDRRQPDDGAGADGQHRDLEAGASRDAERLLHAEAARGRGPAARRHQLPARRSAGDLEPPDRLARPGGHPLHRQHGGVQQHVEARRARTWAGTGPIPGWSARRAARTSSSCTRRPIRRRWRSRSPAAASSIRARSARRRAACTSRSRCGPTSAIGPWR